MIKIENLEDKNIESEIAAYHSKLFPFAYNIVGDMMEAEDIVQETLNKFFLGAPESVNSPDNYLVKAVINKSINQKKLLRSRKEVYPGEWLPVPIATEESIYSKMDRDQILNYSLLILLEKLNAKERAVFILKETFDFSHAEIADILGISLENSRQRLTRAKQKIAPQLSGTFVLKAQEKAVLDQLMDAILKTDIKRVVALLSSSVKATSDGGSKVAAARNILVGSDTVSKFLKALWHKYRPGAEVQLTAVNHQPGLIFKDKGLVFRCMVFEIINRKIVGIYIIVNPDKLQHLNFNRNLSRLIP